MKTKYSARVTSFLLAMLLLFALLPVNMIAAADSAVTLTIIHVNDRHGRMGADPYISQLAEDTKGNVLILDAGDALHGQIAANLTKGAAMVELMNEVCYSAMVTGNHEYTYGIDRLLELSEMMDFPLLAANVKDADGKNLFGSCEIFKMNGVTVGMFGLATPETIASSDPRNIQGVVFDDPVKTAQAEVAELKAKGCDIIIALTHLGLDNLSDPKDRSDTLAGVDGIDVIIDGHSHTKLDNGLFVGDTLIAQTGEYGGNIGVVEITIKNGAVSKTAKLIPVDGDSLAADESILAKIAELDKANEAVTSVVVGTTPVFLQGEKTPSRIGGTNLADMITDSMRLATGADMAFMTGGNIRASIDAGDITMGEVLTTLPYSNLLATVELTGADIINILEHGVDTYPEAVGHYIHVSGLRFTFDPKAKAGSRVKGVKMSDGTTLQSDKTYTVATIDFIASGGDGYDMMPGGKNLTYYGSDAEAFIDYLATKPAINAEPEHRVSALAANALYVVMPDATHGFTGESIRHAEDELKTLSAQAGLAYKLCKTADAGLQSDTLDEAIQAKAAAVVLWPITGEPLREAAQRVKDAGIPLIVYDRLIPGLDPASEVLGDNTKIANMAGAYFNNYFAAEIASGETISILELAGDDSTVPKQRTQGFTEIAGDNANVVKRFDTQWQREVARGQMENWLNTASAAEIESVQAIYSHEDETVLGAMDAIAAYKGSAKLNIRLIIGLGGKRDLIMHTGYYKEHFGIDLVTYAFSPAMIREAINDGAKAAAGETPHKECLIDTFEIHCHTLAEYLASETYKTRYTNALPRFDDVPESAWYSNSVSSISIEGYMGTGSNFNPDAPVTEKEACELLDELLLYVKAEHHNDNTRLTREQLAVLIENTLHSYIIHKEVDYHYADEANISPEALSSVMCVYRLGIMRGVGGDRFDPNGVVTRAQMAAVINNLMNACLNSAAGGGATHYTPDELEALALEAYIYAFPLVLVGQTELAATNHSVPGNGGAPVNQLYHATKLADASFKQIVRANVDTLYSSAYLDLTNSPMMFTVPKTDRFCSVQVSDAYTNCIAILGTGGLDEGRGGTYLFTGPGYDGDCPKGVTEIKSPTNTVFLLARTICEGEDDLPNVYEIQSRMSLIPLAYYGKAFTPPAGTESPDNNFVPVNKVLGMDVGEFFSFFNSIAVTNPPVEADAALMEKLKPLGIGAGLVFKMDAFTAEQQATLKAVPEKALAVIKETPTSDRTANGWTFPRDTVARFGTDYRYRAAIALWGLWANPVEIALYPSLTKEENGADLDGTNQYVLHFEPGMLPPCDSDGFWSITAYGADSFMIDNPIDRYCINDRSGFIVNDDGSVDLYIQKSSPGAAYERNWLPVSEGKFSLTMRIYFPDDAVLSGKWMPPLIIAA